MGKTLFDRYSLLHFLSGMLAANQRLPITWWFVLHSMFELAENTRPGMRFLNFVARNLYYPGGGKKHADSWSNMIGDQISAQLGWFVAWYFFVWDGEGDIWEALYIYGDDDPDSFLRPWKVPETLHKKEFDLAERCRVLVPKAPLVHPAFDDDTLGAPLKDWDSVKHEIEMALMTLDTYDESQLTVHDIKRKRQLKLLLIDVNKHIKWLGGVLVDVMGEEWVSRGGRGRSWSPEERLPWGEFSGPTGPKKRAVFDALYAANPDAPDQPAPDMPNTNPVPGISDEPGAFLYFESPDAADAV